MKTGEPVESLSLLTKLVLLMRKFNNSYRYHKYHMVHAHLDKILSKMQKCTNISNKCQFGTMLHCMTDVHLMNMSP